MEKSASLEPKGAAPAPRFRDQSRGHPPGKIDGEQQSQGIIIPFGDLLIGATALEVGYSILTVNVRHFRLIPGLTVVPL